MFGDGFEAGVHAFERQAFAGDEGFLGAFEQRIGGGLHGLVGDQLELLGHGGAGVFEAAGAFADGGQFGLCGAQGISQFVVAGAQAARLGQGQPGAKGDGSCDGGQNQESHG